MRIDLALLGLTLAGCLLAAAGPAGETSRKFNIKDFGAVGDGAADDQEAIQQASAALTAHGGGTLYFPDGVYRTAKEGVKFKGISNLTVYFEPGAVLLMDNLDPQTKLGRYSHGIHIAGPGDNIGIYNARVEWKELPAKRSMGDGFRFDGYPEDGKTLSHLRLISCQTRFAPQTGAIFMGCSDVMVRDFKPTRTLADGLHLNACRRVTVDGVIGEENGDDTLAFVTYYHPTALNGEKERPGPPYAQPDLGEWNNTDSTAVNIVSRRGQADGVRIAGGLNIALSNLVVDGKWGGLQLDATERNENPRTVGWSYLASRGIVLSNLTFSNCANGLLIRTLNVSPDQPEERWRPEVTITNLSARNCREHGVMVRDSGGVELNGLISDSPVAFVNARGSYTLRNARLNSTTLLVDSVQTAEFQGFSRNGEPQGVADPGDVRSLPVRQLTFSGLVLVNSQFTARRCAGLRLTETRILSAAGPALTLEKCRQVRLAGLELQAPAEPLSLTGCAGVELSGIELGPNR